MTTAKTWHPNYQPRDWAVVDYHEFHVEGCDVPFRGPGFDPFKAEKGSFFACMGAAQTYGCLFERPYATILSEAIGLPALNLAVGGAGPGFYPQFESLIAAMNRARFVILQCMSGRSESNSLYEANGYVEFVRERATGEVMTSSDAWHKIVADRLGEAQHLLEETRKSWIESSHRLLSLLEVPVIFFWYSRRKPDYEIDYDAIRAQLAKRAAGEQGSFFVDGLVGDFPQVIDAKTARAVADRCTAYAECLSSRGMNQVVLNRFTGKPFENPGLEGGPEYTYFDFSKNAYYPSAEMHEDAAAALLPVVKGVMAKA